jgi:hypothetical protein
MLKHYRSAAVAVSALLVASGLAYGAGNYLTYPIVGQPSFCASNVTGTGGFTIPQGNTGGAGATGQGQGVGGATVCAQTIPAGPPALTGGELIPMDTGAQIPATVTMSSTWLHAGYKQIVTTGTTVTVAPGIQNLILNLAATTMAVTLPAAPYDNQQVTISNASTVVSTFSVAANTGQSLVQGAAPTNLAAQAANTAATAQSEVAYIYNLANTSWYRIH